MCNRLICSVLFLLILSLVGNASAAVLYSDTFNRVDSDAIGTNDNGLGGIIFAPWIEVESAATNHRISTNTLTMAGGNGNSFIDHKFTSDELLTSFTVEFDVAQNPHESADHWFALELAPAPESFTTGIDVNQNRVTFGLLMRPGTNFVVWDNGANLGNNNSEIIDNSTGPVSIKLQIDSPNGYNDGNTATVRLWINNVPVENFGGGNFLDFTWQGHTDGLYISIENHAGTREGIDNLVISSPLSLTQAFDPSPEDQATDVLRDVSLSWTPGESAAQHDVFFGTSLDDVNDATASVDPATVYMGRQSDNVFAPSILDLGQTYYWRVDEVNAAPDYTIFKGDVWQFTVEPVGYPIENISVTASSTNRDDEGPENTINGSGLDENGLHSSESTAMWLSSGVDPNASWIQYEFGKVYKLSQMKVWNYNTSVEPLVGFGIKEATIEYSVDGGDWTVLGTTHEFARGPGLEGYASNTTVELDGVSAKYVRITANSNWGGILNQYGLSEVRFMYIPVWAREPSPSSGTTDVGVDAILSFRAGREAAEHDVYLDTNEQAVVDGTTPVATVTEPGHAPSLDLASTYYWRVDEVNEAETPTRWQGDIWNLSTQEYLVVDDFESYNDIEAGEEDSNLVYMMWTDGFDNPSVNGSTIGYTEAFQPTMETSIIFDGRQSVPFSYNNTVAPYSEVSANVADLQVSQDWTKHGIKGLTLRFYGDPNNALQQMYVKINGSKVTYKGSAEDIRLTAWQMWYIDLASIGVSLSNINTLSIGFERIGTVGGQGVVLLDAIRLYSYERQLVTPSEPNNAGLVVHWPLDEGAGTTANDASGNGYGGTFIGNPQWVAGYKSVGALNLNGIDDSVISRFADETWSAYTMAVWVKANVLWQSANSSIFSNYGDTNGGFQICFDASNNYEYHADVDQVIGVASLNWVHLAVTYDGTTATAYYNGRKVATFTPATDDLTFNKWAIGVNRAENTWFDGSVDDLRFYNIALTPDEIAWLGGMTMSFDRPF